MALSARPIASTSTPNVAPGHMSAGGRNVAPIAFSQIDEIAGSFNVQPDPNFNFQGFSDGRGRQAPEPEPLRNVGSHFDTDSSTFISLLNQGQNATESPVSVAHVKGAFHGLLSRAIRAYEGTAAVIHGTVQPRGASYSATL